MGFDSMPKLALAFKLTEFECGFWQGFDHKNVPVLLGIFLGFAKRQVNIPAIPWPHRAGGYKLTSA